MRGFGWAVVFLVGCGRVGFGPSGETGPGADSAVVVDSAVAEDAARDASPDAMSPRCNPFAVANPLIAYWPLDDLTGGMTVDLSGNDLHGACDSPETCPDPSPGRVGGAAAFTATSVDRLRVSYRPILELTAGYTIAFWVNRGPDDDTPSVQNLLAKAVGPTTDRNSIQIYTDAAALGFYMDGTVAGTPERFRQLVPLVLPEGVWTHVAVSHVTVAAGGDGFQRTYIDGALAATGTTPSAADWDDTDLLIGADRNSGTIEGSANSIIDEVMIFEGALTEAEIARLADCATEG